MGNGGGFALLHEPVTSTLLGEIHTLIRHYLKYASTDR